MASTGGCVLEDLNGQISITVQWKSSEKGSLQLYGRRLLDGAVVQVATDLDLYESEDVYQESSWQATYSCFSSFYVVAAPSGLRARKSPIAYSPAYIRDIKFCAVYVHSYGTVYGAVSSERRALCCHVTNSSGTSVKTRVSEYPVPGAQTKALHYYPSPYGEVLNPGDLPYQFQYLCGEADLTKPPGDTPQSSFLLEIQTPGTSEGLGFWVFASLVGGDGGSSDVVGYSSTVPGDLYFEITQFPAVPYLGRVAFAPWEPDMSYGARLFICNGMLVDTVDVMLVARAQDAQTPQPWREQVRLTGLGSDCSGLFVYNNVRKDPTAPETQDHQLALKVGDTVLEGTVTVAKAGNYSLGVDQYDGTSITIPFTQTWLYGGRAGRAPSGPSCASPPRLPRALPPALDTNAPSEAPAPEKHLESVSGGAGPSSGGRSSCAPLLPPRRPDAVFPPLAHPLVGNTDRQARQTSKERGRASRHEVDGRTRRGRAAGAARAVHSAARCVP